MKFEEAGKKLEAEQPAVSRQKEARYMKPVPDGWQENLSYLEPVQNANLSMLQQNLDNCMRIIDDEVMKGYVSQLANLSIQIPEKRMLDSLQSVHFFKITELVYQKDEFTVHKLASMFHALSNKRCMLVLMIKSDGCSNEFFLGVRSMDSRHSTGTMMQMLRQSLTGLFSGSRVEDYYEEDLNGDMESLYAGCISSVTCVADFKQDKDGMSNQNFIQGLEKFADSMQGKAYTAILLAENLSRTEMMDIRNGYESIYTQIAPFADMQLSFSASDSKSSSRGHSSGKAQNTSYAANSSYSLNEGSAHANSKGYSTGYASTETAGANESAANARTHTKGTSSGMNYSESDAHTKGGTVSAGLHGGVNFGVSASANASFARNWSNTHTVSNGRSETRSMSDSISRTLTYGLSHSQSQSTNHGISRNKSITHSYGSSIQQGTSRSSGETFSMINSSTWTDTLGTSQGVTLKAKNKTLSSMMERIEKQLKRMEECESIGMWNFAAYFIGESAAETETAANTYQSVISGTQSGIERSAINTWTDRSSLEPLSDYVKHFMHPCFEYNGFEYNGVRTVSVTPAVLVSTNELAIHMGLPRHSVKGLPVMEHAVFAQEVLSRKQVKDDACLNLGNIWHLGTETNTRVRLDMDSLAMHVFVAGSTGAGKSNTIYRMLSEAEKKNIPYLIIEPAKGEYKKVFPHVRCFGTNPNIGRIIRINPFSFPKEIHVLEHIDHLVEIFNVCWPMYAAMPAVLKESIERAYVCAGWDMDLSVNTKIDGLYPDFDDVLGQLNELIHDSAYSEDTKGDYIGALSMRLKSLTNGINGKIFSGNEMDMKLLFEENAILDISRIGSTETKALIMGLTVWKLQEYRMSQKQEMNAGLKHLTVLEEAHNLLKKTSMQQGHDSANIQGKSVEMLTNAIAEMRTFGEGFIIADQAPDLLDTAAIRNTNTKIVLRLPEGNDRRIMGASMALTEKQTLEISKFPTGVASVYQNEWQEAVLCRMPEYKGAAQGADKPVPDMQIVSKKERNDHLLHRLLKNDFAGIDINELRHDILQSGVSAKIRKDLLLNLSSRNLHFEWALADFIQKNYSFSEVFQGTQAGAWESMEDLCRIMMENIEEEFGGFCEEERRKILYYICRVEHERFPDNAIIEQLRVDYLKKGMTGR